MAIELKPEDQEFVAKQVASGKYRSEQEVITDGLNYLRENDIAAGYTREEFNALLEEGERDFENGDYVELDDAEFERIIAEARQELEEEQKVAAK